MSDTHIHIHLDSGTVESAPSKAPRTASKRVKAPTPAKPRKKDLAMSRAMKAANKKARLKNGSFRKGWDRARIMSEAHRLKKKG